MAVMIDLAKEFGYKIGTFHHAVESYKIADLLRDNGTCSAMWADWWGFKMEAYDGIKENIPLVDKAGACAIVHSDDSERHPAPEPGSRQGARRRPSRWVINISDERAWTWLSLQSGQGARYCRQDRQPEGRQDGRRRPVERQSVQHLYAA